MDMMKTQHTFLYYRHEKLADFSNDQNKEDIQGK